MSVYQSEIIFYGTANMPETDTGTIGGAVDLTRRIGFVDPAAASLFDVVSSSGSDTATKIAAYGRSSTGLIQTETLTLNGTTKVAGTLSQQRLLYAALSGATANGPVANPGGTSAVGDVAYMSHTLVITAHTARAGSANATGVTPPLFFMQTGDVASIAREQIIRITGGTGSGQLRRIINTTAYGTDVVAVSRNWSVIPDATSTYEVAAGMLFEITPNPVTCITRHFATVTADTAGGGTLVYYEKIGVLNTDASTDLTTTSIIKQADPAGLYSGGGALDIALVTAKNDAGTSTNRLTTPTFTGTAFTSGAAPQTAAATPNLVSGNSAAQTQMIWLRLTLAAGQAPGNSFDTMRAQGTTT